MLLNDAVSVIFKTKLIKKVTDADHPILNEYIAQKKLIVVLKHLPKTCEYFKKWYDNSCLIKVIFD